MIDLYTWGTPNGRKVSIMLEECGLPYRVHQVDIGKDEQFKPEFLAHQPEQPHPGDRRSRRARRQAAAAVRIGRDPDLSRREDRASSCPRTARQVRRAAMADVPDGRRRADVRPGASFPARRRRTRFDYGIERYGDEAKRLYGVLDTRLPEAAYLGGDEYSIADIATFPWVARHEWHRVDLARLSQR